MPLYNINASYEMQIHLTVNTADEKNVILIKPVKGADIPNCMAKAYTQGILYRLTKTELTNPGDLQLISPFQIKTIFFILQP